MNRRLAELRAPQVAERLSAASMILQPLGAIEQHGPHLPFDTDLVIAAAVADAAVAEFGDAVDAWLLPPLAYTKSNQHAWSAGAVWPAASTLLAVLDGIGRSGAMVPGRQLAFVEGAGGEPRLAH